ncbi:MAG: Ni/Fe hydrogenase subunit alpha [Chloroflexi bacterium]|nr:Ni/Fe hydrogenase subunit alpha [Ardenticatenaceae bacterium]MBL1126930.1 Ni/Fe hydrogenase subunit alpha [Chloroflexota bacterium]NOG32987.1 Ni/Fe hydrogenase subunit alpha [Chloroflexota bacterium]GIK54713.1 MAG: F420-non-reducing hydrogenase subunit A, selenocysteine-containing [Chloroflexota bacterium]
MTRITIDPITRLEGHGKIEIFLDEAGDVANTYFQIPELRGFERFCVGRPVEEMPLLTNRICGVCPEAHHMAAAKAADAVYGVEPPSAAKKLRELLYMGFYFTDHTTHFYALGGPDFVMGPDAPVAERNILGVIHKVGLEIGGKVIQARKYGHTIVEMLGGRKVHPCTSIPGGVTKGLTEAERVEIEQMGRWGIAFAQFSLQLFSDIVLGNPVYLDLILGDIYTHRTHYIGLVDAQNRVNFYDGRVSVVDPDGKRLGKYGPDEYNDWIAERVEPWTYLKFPYLKKVGWKGFTDGKESGIYMATPLSRLNAADGMATPLAQEQYQKFYETLGGKPVHQRLATHWARLIELLYAAERLVELATDEEITSPHIHTVPTKTPTEGVGIVEAPRGTLTHHYWTDERGILTKVNLIVGTTNNYAPISMSIKKAAQSLIHKDTEVNEGLLNMVEMAFRAYDPCFGCATHSLPGQMPLEVAIRDAAGEPVRVLRQHC